MSKTKTEPIFPTSTAVDAEASSESAAPPASGTSRQRALAVRKAGSSNAVSGPNREAKLEGSKQRKGKQHGGSAAAVGSAPPQPANRRRPRGSSVTFAADYSTPCVAASTISRPSSPSNDGNRYKKASVGPKNAPLPTGTSMSKEEKINLPSAVGKSSAGVPTTSLRVSHRNWQSNCMLLYKHIMSHILEWPTLSVQWLHSCNPYVIQGAQRVLTDVT